MQWFRLYHGIIDDPKFAMMSDSEQLLWLKLLCLASMSAARGTITLTDDEICFKLRLTPEVWQHAKDKFRVKGLIDFTGSGAISISSWEEQQYDSDSAAERMRRHRERKKKGVTSPLRDSDVTVTFQNRTDSEQNRFRTEQIQNRTDSDPEIGNVRADMERDFQGIDQVGDVTPCNALQDNNGLVDVHPDIPGHLPDIPGHLPDIPKQKGKRSRVEPDYEWFKITYNADKPRNWAECLTLNDRRKRAIAGLIHSCPDEQEARSVFTDALTYARGDAWCQTTPLSFDNVMTNNKPLQWAERHRSGSRSMAIPAKTLQNLTALQQVRRDVELERLRTGHSGADGTV